MMPYFQDISRCHIRIETKPSLRTPFVGVGFHVAHYMNEAKSSRDHLEQVIAKRWRELRPSFARVWHNWEWNQAELESYAAHLLRMQQDAGTVIYMTTSRARPVDDQAELAEYARLIADQLAWLIEQKGCTQIKYYCMCNELSMQAWGDMRYDLERFRAYHQAFYDEFKKRGLPVGLLATDASPKERWNTMLWAEETMDDITAVYGGHTYFNDIPPDRSDFYNYWREYTDWAGALSRRTGKPFILGEFGCAQDNRVVDGVLLDRCRHFYDEQMAPQVALQLADAVIASINSGLYAAANWTFSDYPDPDPGARRINKWGTFRWGADGDCTTRPHYYGYGLLTRYLRGPATACRTAADDSLVHVAALEHEQGTWAFAVCNRNACAVPITLNLDQPLNLKLRRYTYRADSVQQHPFGDLPDHDAVVTMKNGVLTDNLDAGSLTIYSDDYVDKKPAAIEEVTASLNQDNEMEVCWQPSADEDLCYYRVYRGEKPDFQPQLENQVASTVACSLIDRSVEGSQPLYYRVIAVDQSGNAG